MPDEPVVAEPEAEPVVVEAEAEPQAKPHPLAPGGVRFEQVNAQKNEAERQLAEMRDRVARLEGAVQRPTPTTPAPTQQTYTPQQLQTLVDQGQITPALMADQLAWQRTQQGNAQMLQTLKWQRTAETALAEVTQYIGKLPALTNTASPEFQRVATAAGEIAEEMGLTIQDPRVQRRALRETFGSLEKLATVGKAGEFNRAHADTHAETGGGGGAAPSAKKSDPLAGVSKVQLDYWKSKGYTQKMMEAEAPFVKRRV